MFKNRLQHKLCKYHLNKLACGIYNQSDNKINLETLNIVEKYYFLKLKKQNQFRKLYFFKWFVSTCVYWLNQLVCKSLEEQVHKFCLNTSYSRNLMQEEESFHSHLFTFSFHNTAQSINSHNSSLRTFIHYFISQVYNVPFIRGYHKHNSHRGLYFGQQFGAV